MTTLNPRYRYKSGCTNPTATPLNGVVVLQPSCDPIDQAFINEIISYIISNDLFIINQGTDTQTPGTYKIVGSGTASRFSSKKFELLNSSEQIIATLQHGTI